VLHQQKRNTDRFLTVTLSFIIPIQFLLHTFDRPYRRNMPPLEKASAAHWCWD